MSVDLAKAAYLKAEELALRVAALESKKPSPTFSETDMSFKVYCKGSGRKTVVFRAIGEQNLLFRINVDTPDVTASAYLNGEAITLSNGQAYTSRDIGGGENEFFFEFSGANNIWVEVSLTVEGFLEKYEKKKRLTAIGGSYFSYLDDGTFYLCSAPSQTPIVAIYDVKHAFANFTQSAGLFVSYIDFSGRLKIQRYYTNGNLYVETEAEGNYSECLVRVKRGYVILYVISGNYVKTGFVEFSGETSLTRTNIRAKEITFRQIGNNDYLLVTDIDDNVYLCSLSQTDYVTVETKRSAGKLERGNLTSAGGDPAVWYYKGGAVLETTFYQGRFTPGRKVAIAEEAIRVDAGYRVMRIGDGIVVTN